MKVHFGGRLFLAAAVLGAVAVTSALPPVAMAQEPGPTFYVGLHFNGLSGKGWPAEVDVMVTADDPGTVGTPTSR